MKSKKRIEMPVRKLMILACLFMLFTIACDGERSSDSKNTLIEKISNDGEIYNDVAKLLNAEGAWAVMWKDQGEPIDFEIRIYGSHSEALEYGVSFADDITGKDAIVKKSESMWAEGLRDRVVLASRLRDWGGVAGQKRAPKYLGYFVYSNIILLCEGLEAAESIIHCSNLINELR